MIGELSPWHLLIVAAVFVVLFGSKRLPDAARSLGRSLRILKAETRGLRDDIDAERREIPAAGTAEQSVTKAPAPATPATPPDPQ